MRKAEYIVSQLLEDAANGTTSVFGPDLPVMGIRQPSLDAALRRWLPFTKETPAADPKVLDWAINQGYSFVVQKNPKDLVVYSKTGQVRVADPKTIKSTLSLYGISPEAKVSWKQSSAAAGHVVPISQVFVEKAPDEDSAKPAAPVTAPGQPDPLKGPEAQSNPERERQVAAIAKKPVEGIPVSFGLEISKVNHGDIGAKVWTVDSNGPSSRGIQPGDLIIELGPFETDRGTFGPYKVSNLQDFKTIGGMMQGLIAGFAVPVKINRGGRAHNATVIPEPQSDRDDAYMRRHLKDAERLTVAEIAQKLERSPEEVQNLLKRHGGRAKDWIPPQTASDTIHIKGAQQYAPNLRPPASQTGNQRANVSSIT